MMHIDSAPSTSGKFKMDKSPYSRMRLYSSLAKLAIWSSVFLGLIFIFFHRSPASSSPLPSDLSQVFSELYENHKSAHIPVFVSVPGVRESLFRFYGSMITLFQCAYTNFTHTVIQEAGVGENSNWSNLYDLEGRELTPSSSPDFSKRFPKKREARKVERKEQSAKNRECPTLLPFKFVALEACLENACSCLENEVRTLELEAHPVHFIWPLLAMLYCLDEKSRGIYWNRISAKFRLWFQFRWLCVHLQPFQISGIIVDLRSASLYLDPLEEEAWKFLRELLHGCGRTTNYRE